MSGEIAGKGGRITGIFLDLEDFPIPTGISPNTIHDNIKLALENKGFPVDWIQIFLYAEKIRMPAYMVDNYKEAGFDFTTEGAGKISRTGWMLFDIHLWILDAESPPNNLMIVSNTISEEPEFRRVLETLKSRGHNVLLVEDEVVEEHGFLTESSQWLWESFGKQSYSPPKCCECGIIIE